VIQVKLLYAPRIKLVDRSLNIIDDRASIIDRGILSGERLNSDLLLYYFVYLYQVVIN